LEEEEGKEGRGTHSDFYLDWRYCRYLSPKIAAVQRKISSTDGRPTGNNFVIGKY